MTMIISLRISTCVSCGGDGEIAFLVADLVAEVGEFLAAAVPDAFVGIDVVVAAVGGLAEADVVEDEELGFGTEVRRVGDAGLLQIRLGFAGDVARVAAYTARG